MLLARAQVLQGLLPRRRSHLLFLHHRPSTIAAAGFSSDSKESGSKDVDLVAAATQSKTPRKPQPFYKRIFSGESKEEQQHEIKLSDQEQEWQRQEAEYEQILEEERQRELMKRRNKSKLRASDRRMLHGLPPLRGVEFEYDDDEREQENKMNLLGMFGSRATGISPRVSWLTQEDLKEKREWEKVFYDGRNLRETIEHAEKKRRRVEDERRKREEDIDKNFKEMEKMMKQWKDRVDTRNKVAQKEKDRKEKILADLRQEFGYDVDPRNPQFADKIAEKEKAYMKAEKEERKVAAKEKAIKLAEEEKKRKEEEESKS